VITGLFRQEIPLDFSGIFDYANSSIAVRLRSAGKDEMSQGACKYKIDPAPVFLFAYIAGSLLCSVFVVMLAVFDPAFRQAKLPVVLETIGYVLVIFGPPYAALAALVLTHCFRYEVTADGVRGKSWLGGAQFVRWADVSNAKPFRVGNLEFVRLTAAQGRRVWLPMFVHAASPVESEAFVWITPGTFSPADSPILSVPSRARS
jgi:hypothetical protein